MRTNNIHSTLERSEHEQPARAVAHGVEAEYLTAGEVAERLRWSRRTLRAKIKDGVFRRDEHFFVRLNCQPRWKWSAVAKWLEGK